RLHSIESGCAFLGGVSKNTLQGWLSQGKLRRTKVGSRTMVRESELMRMIEDGGKSRSPNIATPAPAPARRRGRPRKDQQEQVAWIVPWRDGDLPALRRDKSWLAPQMNKPTVVTPSAQ